MKNTYNKLHKKILYNFVYFILFIKFVYLFLFILSKYLKIDDRIAVKRHIEADVYGNTDNIAKKYETLEKVLYYKTLSENIFIIASSILLVYLFYPYHHNDLLNDFLNNQNGKFLIFIYSLVILLTFDWQSFRPTLR